MIQRVTLERASRALSSPFRRIFAAVHPLGYARWIGVKCAGNVKIYGSSYSMFSTEPFLVTLGDNVYISVGAKFVCHDGSTLPFRRIVPDLEIAGPITVGNSVFIGMGALILPGVTIGDNCIVGANSVVTKDVDSGTIVAGNPAKTVSTTAEFFEKAKRKSLKIGHLRGSKKELEYRRIFGVDG